MTVVTAVVLVVLVVVSRRNGCSYMFGGGRARMIGTQHSQTVSSCRSPNSNPYRLLNMSSSKLGIRISAQCPPVGQQGDRKRSDRGPPQQLLGLHVMGSGLEASGSVGSTTLLRFEVCRNKPQNPQTLISANSEAWIDSMHRL